MITLPREILIENLALSWEGKRLCTSEPLLETRRKLSSIERQSDTLYVLCSPLHGAGLEEVLGWLPENSVVTCVELRHGLGSVLLERQEWGFLPLAETPVLQIPAVFRTLATSPSPLASEQVLDGYEIEISRLFLRGLRRISMISFHGGRRLEAEGYSELETRLNASLQRFWRNQSTMLHLGGAWIRNSYSNLPLLPLATPLPDLSGKTLVLVGAGPSLDTNIGFLKAARSTISIMTVDTALPCLMHQGIKPDFVVVLESQQANLRDFIACDLSGIHVVADLSAHTGFLPFHDFSGSKRGWQLSFFASRFWPCGWWQFLDSLLTQARLVLPIIPPLGSVGLASLKIAELMNPAAILVAGLDFACQAGKSHARGSPALQSALLSLNRFRGFPATGFGEAERLVSHAAATLYTTDVLESYCNDTTTLFQAMKHRGIRIFDMRPWGMKLDIEALTSLEGSKAQTLSPGNIDAPALPCRKDLWLPSGQGPALSPPEIIADLLDQHTTDLDSLVSLVDTELRIPRSPAEPGNRETGFSPALTRGLEAMDQFLLRIPPHRRKTPGFLVQARLELWYFRRLLSKITLRMKMPD